MDLMEDGNIDNSRIEADLPIGNGQRTDLDRQKGVEQGENKSAFAYMEGLGHKARSKDHLG